MTTASGLLLVDKAQGVTSHDVVARVRKLLNERRVGHAGTLDPMATGLLILGVGSATRLIRFATGEQKRYTGRVKLGVATDSLDADGQVVTTVPVPQLEESEFNAIAETFLGAQTQIPPMVSALRHGGQRLHSLARQGIEVERAPRDILVSSFSLTRTADPSEWDFSVDVSPGTYVRVLLADLAERVGTVGHLSALRRTQSGQHKVTSAVTVEALEVALEQGEDVLAAPKAFMSGLVGIVLSEEEILRIRMGQRLDREVEGAGNEIAVYNQDGDFVAVLRRSRELWKPEIVLDGAHGRDL
jgi:tRNA pseudouridine55 synthase